MRPVPVAVLALALLAHAAASAQLTTAQFRLIAPDARSQARNQDICDTCVSVVASAESFVGSNQSQSALTSFLLDNVCPALPDQLQPQCTVLVPLLVPQASAWFNASAPPAQDVCTAVGACSAPGLLRQPSPQQLTEQFFCPFCEMSVTTVVETLLQPDTEKMLRKAGHQACGLVADANRPECVSHVDSLVDQMLDVAKEVDPHVTCARVGWCDAESRMAQTLALVAASLRASAQSASNDGCEICQIAVMEAAALIGDPKTQAAIIDAAKEACGLVSQLKDQCKTVVDEYAPVAFNILQMYLKPQQLCGTMGVCPHPAPAPPVILPIA